jgi:hypothetical protein
MRGLRGKYHKHSHLRSLRLLLGCERHGLPRLILLGVDWPFVEVGELLCVGGGDKSQWTNDPVPLIDIGCQVKAGNVAAKMEEIEKAP